MKTCTWCAGKFKEGETVRTKTDAQGYTHFFHPECWDRHTAAFGEKLTIIVQGVDKTEG